MPPTSREGFLNAVRVALGRADDVVAPDYLPLKLRPEDQRQKVVTIEARARARQPQLMERLAGTASRQGWKVRRVTSPEEAVTALTSIAREKGARSAVRSAHAVFQRLPVEAALRGQGVQVTMAALGPRASRERLRAAMAQADMGVTGVDYAIAETGSIVLAPRQGVSRLVSLLPPVHVAIVEAQQIYETLDDLWALRRLAFLEGHGDMGSYQSLISGPSRTADLEQTLVVGVHGPLEAHMVILEG
ncbi:MAG: lactate utilization protein [Chloroflexi bacterium]|nr:lactate utilization protein [Chloroflexota bacterium]